MRGLLCLFLTFAPPAPACDVALALTVDVSGSIDPAEYRLQMDGMAAALADPSVAEALVSANAQVAVIQWSGRSRQELSVPWRQISTFEDADALVDAVRRTERPWRHFSTAIGEALEFTFPLFESVKCKRQVIDVSGDGRSNEGRHAATARDRALARGIEINGLVILGAEEDGLTEYFRDTVIGGPAAFVYEARNFADYPRAIRRKLLDELTEPVS